MLPSLKPARHPVYRLAVADAESLRQHVIAHRLAADGFEDSLSEGSHGCIISLTSSVGHPNKLLAAIRQVASFRRRVGAGHPQSHSDGRLTSPCRSGRRAFRCALTPPGIASRA